MENRDYIEYCGLKQLLEKINSGTVDGLPEDTNERQAVVQFLENRTNYYSQQLK